MKHLCFLILTTTTTFLYSYENITISGTIKDSNNNPIQNVNIYSDINGVSTNEIGSFTLTCVSDELVTISHISYSDIILKAKDIPSLIIMKSRNINSDEIITIETKPSECVIFHPLTIHRSVPVKKISLRPRYTIDIRFFDKEFQPKFKTDFSFRIKKFFNIRFYK